MVRDRERAQVDRRDRVVRTDDERPLGYGIDRETGCAEIERVAASLKADRHAVERCRMYASVGVDHGDPRRRESVRSRREQQGDAERVDDRSSCDLARKLRAAQDMKRLRIDDDNRRARGNEDPASRQPGHAARRILHPQRDHAERSHPLDVDDPDVSGASGDRHAQAAGRDGPRPFVTDERHGLAGQARQRRRVVPAEAHAEDGRVDAEDALARSAGRRRECQRDCDRECGGQLHAASFGLDYAAMLGARRARALPALAPRRPGRGRAGTSSAARAPAAPRSACRCRRTPRRSP